MKPASPYIGTGALLLVILAIMWLPWLGETLFYSKGEPREAIVAVTMLKSGNWVLPLSYGADFPYKPPLLAWLIAGFAWLFNNGEVNEYISRLPSALAAIGMIWGVFAWARTARNERFALMTALITATSFEVFRAAMACRVDMVLTACIVGAILILYDIHRRRGRFNLGRWLAVWLLLTGAVLTKGPVGALLPCLVAGIYRLLRGERFWPTLCKLTAVCITSLALPALWYYAAWKTGGQPFLDLAWEENIGRLTGTMSYESHVNPFYYNFLTILAGMCPWTLLAVMSIWGAKRHFQQRPFKAPGMLAATAAVIVIGFYCIPASKRSVYLLPAYPFMAYAVACIADSLRRTRIVGLFTWILAIIGVLFPVAVVAIRFFVPSLHTYVAAPQWWQWVILGASAIPPIIWMCEFRMRVGAGWACTLAVVLLTVYSAYGMSSVLNRQSDLPAAQRLEAMTAPGETVWSDGDTFYSINYYLGDRVRRVSPSGPEGAQALPAHAVVIFPDNEQWRKTYSTNFTLDSLTARSADHRTPLAVAVKH